MDGGGDFGVKTKRDEIFGVIHRSLNGFGVDALYDVDIYFQH